MSPRGPPKSAGREGHDVAWGVGLLSREGSNTFYFGVWPQVLFVVAPVMRMFRCVWPDGSHTSFFVSRRAHPKCIFLRSSVKVLRVFPRGCHAMSLNDTMGLMTNRQALRTAP